jgi:hypothetical protein
MNAGENEYLDNEKSIEVRAPLEHKEEKAV